jgi:hypothetical protein
MEADKLVESVKFLLRSVRDLSDRFVESNQGISNTFTSVYADIRGIQEQLDEIKLSVDNAIDEQLLSSDASRVKRELPVKEEEKQHLIPALNLPLEGLLDVYRNTPVLLQPFARPCSISGKTLSGEISEVELEVFAQGTSWVIETQDGDWVLVPRPGMLQRQKQVEGLGRLFDLATDDVLPAEVELLKAGSATVIEHGRRWYLKHKGEIGIQSDPLQRSLEQRLALIEKKLSL